MKKVLCLMGPTAIGKTSLVIDLSRKFPIEIVSVDSAMVYRQLTIGANKPSPEELEICPHHLINVVDVDQAFHVQLFLNLAQQAINDCLERGKIPILVGGTMMYFYALSQGLAIIPSINQDQAEVLYTSYVNQPLENLYLQLLKIDPTWAQRVSEQDRQRIERGLIVHALTGQPLSSYFDNALKLPFDFKFFALCPSDTENHRAQIALRIDKMMKEGFKEEVRELMNNYPKFDLDCWKYVGYRQLREAFIHHQPIDLAVEKICIATHQLAKRQKTWLNKFPQVHKIFNNGHEFDVLESHLLSVNKD